MRFEIRIKTWVDVDNFLRVCMLKKRVQACIKLQISAGAASPSPPVGPALGQQGVNIIEFCKEFNARTAKLESGLPIPVVVTVYNDRSFSFVTKTPPASVLLKKAAGIGSGSNKPSVVSAGEVTRAQVYDIARIKAIDMTGIDIEAVSRSIIGTAHSIGIEVKE